MFDVGFAEILLIGIVSLVVIGPERLPVVAKTAGQWIGKMQRFVRGVKTDLASELESGDLKKLIGDQREQINELKQMVSTAKKEFESSAKDVVTDAKRSLGELETSVKELDADDSISHVSTLNSAQTPNSDAGADTLKQVSDVASSKEDSSHTSSSSTSAGHDSSSSSASVGVSTEKSVSQATTAADGQNAETASTMPPDNIGGPQTPTLRTETTPSENDSASMNRAGTESGS